MPEAGLEKLVSGGQSGVDRAALDAALAAGLPCGGWCPKGRRAEDGVIPSRYPLIETPAASYECRTEWNVRDADATLILARGPLLGGTALTRDLAERYGKPLRIVDLERSADPDPVMGWIRDQRIRVLNVAGPRESGCPGIYRQAFDYLHELLVRLSHPRLWTPWRIGA